VLKKEPKQYFRRIPTSMADWKSITYDRISLPRFPEKSFSTATGDYTTYRERTIYKIALYGPCDSLFRVVAFLC